MGRGRGRPHHLLHPRISLVVLLALPLHGSWSSCAPLPPAVVAQNPCPAAPDEITQGLDFAEPHPQPTLVPHFWKMDSRKWLKCLSDQESGTWRVSSLCRDSRRQTSVCVSGGERKLPRRPLRRMRDTGRRWSSECVGSSPSAHGWVCSQRHGHICHSTTCRITGNPQTALASLAQIRSITLFSRDHSYCHYSHTISYLTAMYEQQPQRQVGIAWLSVPRCMSVI